MCHKAAINMHLFIYLFIYHAERRLVQPGAARHRAGPVIEALAGPARHGRAEMLAVGAPGEQAGQHRLRDQGWKKPGFFLNQPSGFFFGFLGLFLVFFIYLPRRESF
jgi:hypothetical protein